MTCLEQAGEMQHSSIVASYLGYCLAVNRQEFEKAISLGKEAVAEQPNNPDFCLNLGRIYLLAGKKDDALAILRQGLLFSRDERIIAELEIHGTRKKPLIGFLHRSNPLNKYLGKLVALLG
jgi:Flp pilus assembly protein TadD